MQVGFTEFTPYGSISKQTGSYDPKHKFTGKELDASTGLYFYGARYYDPQIGRFVTADPTIQRPYDPQDLNRYAYCRNNPINLTDPSGLGFKNRFKEFFAKNAGYVALAFGFPGLVAASIYTGNWEPTKNIAIATASGFIFGGPTGAVAAFVATSVLETQPGREYVEWQAQEVFDDAFGMRPRTAYMWSYLVTDAVLTAGVSYGINSMTSTTNAKVVKPEKLTDMQRAEYRKISLDRESMSTSTNGRPVKDMPLNARKALVVDGHVKAIIANDPIRLFSIPTPFEHTAVAIPGGGNFDFDFRGAYLINEGVCHQGRMRALRSAGVTGLTPLDLSWQASNWLSYGVYGTYGGMGYTIDNISQAVYYTRENFRNE